MGNTFFHSDTLNLLVRLDVDSIDEWVQGCIAPDALFKFATRHKDLGTRVRLWVHPIAHVKAYWGSRAFLLGSANFTSRGLSGAGHEMLWRGTSRSEKTNLRAALKRYSKRLSAISIEELGDYVDANEQQVKERRAEKPDIIRWTDENRLDLRWVERPTRFGNYDDFKDWLGGQADPAAQETQERALGKGQLSGHIHRNFYGLRQLLLARPNLLSRFAAEDANAYKLSRDAATEAEIKAFVRSEAADEAQFSLETWKTYLPQECGGRAGKHGGTIGNLNRMLPQVARYLSSRLAAIGTAS